MKKLFLYIAVCTPFLVYSEDSTDVSTKLNQFRSKAYSSLETLYNTYEISCECIENNIPGDFVECGVAAGSQIAAMAYACQNCHVNRPIHLFDSFEGIPLAGPDDDAQPGIGRIPHNTNVADLN